VDTPERLRIAVTADTVLPTVAIDPTSGLPGATVTVTGAGFTPGETVKVGYHTGLASPTKVSLCNAAAGIDGTFECTLVAELSGPGGCGARETRRTGSCVR
jgi:hypothetical protein